MSGCGNVCYGGQEYILWDWYVYIRVCIFWKINVLGCGNVGLV